VPDAPVRVRHVVLVGAMGTGKSTIGTRLAAARGQAFVDNDRSVERQTGLTAAQLAARDGIDALHAAEADVLLAALREPDGAVIAAAASTIVAAEVRAALARDAFVVWLRADPATLAARLPQSPTRPYAAEDPTRLVSEQSRVRDPLFAQAADVTVDTASASPDQAVTTILSALEALPG
jgi:shikimate kinase